MPRFRTGEIALVALFSALVVFQLFIPPSIGLASNGDFSKMIGRFSLAPSSLDTSEEYKYFTARWVYNRAFQWMSDDRSSELIPISGAAVINWWFSSRVFDIRVLGAIHAALWIGCFAAFLGLLRPLADRWNGAVGLLALFIFTDVSYIACCNSFYTDVAAWLFLSWAVVLWLYFIRGQHPSVKLFTLFIGAAVLCVLSKAQHAALGLFLCVLAVIAALSFDGRWRKAGAFSLAALILAAAALSYRLMPKEEKGDDAYAGIFMILLDKSPTPLQDLRDLGLGPEYAPFIGHWPIPSFADPANRPWWDDFNRRAGHGRMARFVLLHPWRGAEIVYRALHNHAGLRRPSLGNYEQQYGFPPGAQTKSFGWWSAIRSVLFRLAPWHVLVWYAAVLGMCVWEKRIDWRLRLLSAILTCMGLVELVVSSMADAGEIPRHLFLFHVITDFTIVLAIVWAAWILQGRANLRASS